MHEKMVEKQTDLKGTILNYYIEPTETQTEKPKPFTTEPKKRKHLKQSISGQRAKHFMEQLWRKGLKKCSYETLKFEFILCFETNDPRVIQKYIGRPNGTKRYSGSSVVRQNRNSGDLAFFMYSNKREIEAQIGLMEILGYIVVDKKTGLCILHHEHFHYFRKQETLNDPLKNAFFKLRDKGDNVKVSKQDLCVRSIGVSKRLHVLDDGGEEGEKRERERVIDYTHTNPANPRLNLTWRSKNEAYFCGGLSIDGSTVDSYT